MLKISNLLKSFWFAEIVLAVHLVLFNTTRVYWEYPDIDIFFHVLGGFSAAHGFLNWLKHSETKKFVKLNSTLAKLIVVLSLVTTVAVVWEFHEFVLQHYTGIEMQPSIADTMADLLLGMIGAAAAVFIFQDRKK